MHITGSSDDSSTNKGPVRIVGGTGAFAGISGSGQDFGTTTPDGFGTGVLTGVLHG